LTTRRGNKHNAVRTWSELCQCWFDSKGEARHGEELRYRELAGEISELQFHLRFKLGRDPHIIEAEVDYVYLEGGVWQYEDFKGYQTATSRVKIAWLWSEYGIEVKIVRATRS